MRLKLILVSLATVSVFAVPGITWAAAIAIDTLLTNASFESGTNGACPTSWTCGGSPGAAAYTPTTAQFVPVTDGIPGIVPNGVRAAYAPTGLAGSGSLTQITASTWASGNTYSFTFWVGVPLTEPNGTTPVTSGPLGDVFLKLLTNGVGDNLCGSTTGECRFDIPAAQLPAPGQWKQFTYNPVITAFGGTIGLLLQEDTTNNNQEVNWDIGPTTPVPEPVTMFLGGTGLILLGYGARRRLFSR
jgi:hypothetical protein